MKNIWVKIAFILLLLLFLTCPAYAETSYDEILIDDFNDGDISDWTEWDNPLYNTLGVSAGYTGYAINISGGIIDEAVITNAYKNEVGLELPYAFDKYNLSFWYYRASSGGTCVDSSTYGNFLFSAYLSEDENDNPTYKWDIMEFRLEEECDQWVHLNQELKTSDFDEDTVDINNDNYIGTVAFRLCTENLNNLLVDEIEIIPTCTENWQCGTWTACTLEGYQTRDCFELNSCGTEYIKPMEIQNCTYSPPVPGCEPDWACYDWGTCVNGIQSRTCYDRHSCNTLNGQPQMSRSCVTPMLDIIAQVADAFERTDTIAISGNVTEELGALKSADVIISISSSSFEKVYQQHNVSRFSMNYTIPQTDPTGTWKIIINATDGIDVGFWEKTISIFEASAFKTYNVIFTSPAEDTPYARGENVGITVKVEQGGIDVSGADVFMYIANQKTTLNETTPGSYHTSYVIPYNTPLGTLPISVRAQKDNIGGTKTANIYVLPATLNIALASASSISIGSSATITANVTYPDGTPASGLDLSLVIPNGTIALTETSPGIYMATYTPMSSAVWNLELNVQDAYENTGTISKIITTTQPGIVDLIFQYWYFITIAVIIVAVVAYPLSKSHSKGSRYNELVAEGQRIMKMQKELQESYFKENEIDMETFKQKSAEYEKRLTELSEEIEKLKPKQF